ncbi:TadE/TadG family type IV pilus assembly protein [Variovorax sp. VNK109]|uniref:TadE/TadG family type IV pilus assembly protein n=1 Tax=Variovorax sp. VNK109 TaxID=3400919 RepID=UPI003C0A0DC7
MRAFRKLNATRKQRGQSMVEYLIILPSLLLLVLGTIQFGLLYQIKSQVNYATFAAARQGALKNGSTNAVKDAFGAAMTPLFTPGPTFGDLLRGRAVGAIEAFNPMVTSIKRINPPPDADLKKDQAAGLLKTDPAYPGYLIIPNDNLLYRPDTVFANSKVNVQDANLLKIRVTYCAKLIVPLANLVFYSLVNGLEGLRTPGGMLYGDAATGFNPSSADCARLKNVVAGPIAKVEAAGEFVGADLSFITDIMQTAQDWLDTEIPVINWVVGGYRIPVSSEAVVRMQTPFKVKQ